MDSFDVFGARKRGGQCMQFGAVGCIVDDCKETAPLLVGGVGGFRHRLCSSARA